jgi:hypothetical protein
MKENRMAQSHHDNQHAAFDLKQFDELVERAKAMSKAGENVITAGKPGEQILLEIEDADLLIRQLPDDRFGLRVSIGEANASLGGGAYIVFRGDRKRVRLLLTRMLNAFREKVPE